MIIPVVLSGGIGSRLWPLSREHYPKQLLALTGEQTLLQNTLIRLQGLPDKGKATVVCNEAHRFMVAEQLRQQNIASSPLLLEPIGRNTAPAIAIAALSVMEKTPDALLLVLPADHVIDDIPAFHQAIGQAVLLAKQGQLVTFGIVGKTPETGYGYIKADKSHGDAPHYPVAQFVEKPDKKTAKAYLASGDYYWNSGMFLFAAQTYLAELGQHSPDILAVCQQTFARVSLDLDADFVRLEADLFGQCRSESIDYAVMEKTDKAAVVPLDAGWNDIGAWSALWDMGQRDFDGLVKSGDVLAIDSKNCYLRAEYRLLATVGVNNLIVVETADAVLVADKNKVQDVKKVVDALKKCERCEVDLHRKVLRPWGSYEALALENRFQVKRITVNPRASLSLQLHYHRAEHWIVVKGTAKVTRDNETFLLTENQSTYIPLGAKHRLENPGLVPLEIIEIQSGAYLGEDDIVRFADDYGRNA